MRRIKPYPNWVSMTGAYALWFFLGGSGAHLAYARRWMMFVVHWAAMLVLAYAWYLGTEDESQLADFAVFAWFAVLIMEGAVLWHQVEDTNLRVRAAILARHRY